MQTILTLPDLRQRLRTIRANAETIALVPTMGALHAGHMTLVERAKIEADRVVISIFVNPKQFGAGEDLDRYPRQEQQDAALLAEAGVDVLWMPPVKEVYPTGFATNVAVAKLGDVLCGAARPGHFDGVATVVAKLFNQVRPDVALFGEKDWQQLAIIRRMATDLDMDVAILGVPTVREADGLALSSRNAYLDEAQRGAAAQLPRALEQAAVAISDGATVAETLERGRERVLEAGFASIDYFELADAATLESLDKLDREARLLIAARIGSTRLIDNIPVTKKN